MKFRLTFQGLDKYHSSVFEQSVFKLSCYFMFPCLAVEFFLPIRSPPATLHGSVRLNQSTTDDLGVRICKSGSDEDTPIQLLEIYIHAVDSADRVLYPVAKQPLETCIKLNHLFTLLSYQETTLCNDDVINFTVMTTFMKFM